MPGKQPNPVHNTPPKDPEKRTKENEPTVCPVCCLKITESNDDVRGTTKRGYTISAQACLKESMISVKIHVCAQTEQSSEIVELRDLVKKLSNELAGMNSKFGTRPLLCKGIC